VKENSPVTSTYICEEAKQLTQYLFFRENSGIGKQKELSVYLFFQRALRGVRNGLLTKKAYHQYI
jgi:hypothetical protein